MSKSSKNGVPKPPSKIVQNPNPEQPAAPMVPQGSAKLAKWYAETKVAGGIQKFWAPEAAAIFRFGNRRML